MRTTVINNNTLIDHRGPRIFSIQIFSNQIKCDLGEIQNFDLKIAISDPHLNIFMNLMQRHE